MAFTTLRAFVDALGDLTITGVTTKRKYIPTNFNTADLPLSYVRVPTNTGELGVLAGNGFDLDRGTAELVVVMSSVMTGIHETNYYATVDMVDSIAAALRTNAISLGLDAYTITPQEDTVGDAAYWAIVATVEASGNS